MAKNIGPWSMDKDEQIAALARDLQDAVIQLNRASGALIDAGTLPTEDVEAGIRALAREAEGLKAMLAQTPLLINEQEERLAKTAEIRLQLERQLAEAKVAYNTLLQTVDLRDHQLADAGQRIEMISNAHNIVVDNLEQAEARVKELEAKLHEQIQ